MEREGGHGETRLHLKGGEDREAARAALCERIGCLGNQSTGFPSSIPIFTTSTSGAPLHTHPQVLFESAPVIWLQPRPTDQFGTTDSYDCPVYRTAERKGVLATTGHSTNFLMMIRMPSELPQWHWTLRGVCMLCSLSD